MVLFGILKLVGALGFFIYGMKIMSEGIQKVAGNKMRQVLSAMTTNRFTGVLTGFLVTSVIQSSSATTVMIVSFVNAGLLKLKQAISVIMGANIGTTVTAVLVIVFGFSKISVASYSLPIIAIAFPLTFARSNKLKSWGEFLIGFAILFMGLEALKDSVPQISPDMLAHLKGLTNMGIFSTLLFILIGSLFTMIVQSSSAAMALTLVMCENGWISFDIAAAIVLGENIGTTITANIAAIVTNTQSKRAARAHFIFNVFGVLWMLIVFPFYLQGIDKIMVNTAAGSPFTNFHAIKWSLTLFHISFNIINTLLLVWFIPQIVKIVKIMVPSKDTDEEYHLEYIGTGLMKTSELSLLEAQKEVAKFGKIVSKMSGYVQNLLEGEQNNKRHKLFDKILKYEQITDRVEVEVVNYLAKISEGRLSKDASNKVRSILSIVSDLERIGDIFYQMSRSIEKMDEDNILFTEMQLANMKALFVQLDQALSIMHDNLKTPYEKVEYEIAQAKELEINEMRNKLRKEYFQDIEKGDYNLKSGMIYNDIFNSCEKVGDHIINVTEAILEDYNEKVLN